MVPIAQIILWVYVGLLLLGGLMGYLKAKSKISLIVSSIFAILIALCITGVIRPFFITEILLGLLILVFGIRFAKGKKFMPSGLMVIISIAVLTVVLLFH